VTEEVSHSKKLFYLSFFLTSFFSWKIENCEIEIIPFQQLFHGVKKADE